MTVGFSVQFIAFAIGIPLGALAGLRGGWVDFVVTRLLEIMTAFPGFLFAIFLMSILGTGMFNIILAIGITSWIDVCRLTRSELIALREREFVVAARSYGSDDWWVIVRHLLPHALPPLVIMLALGIPSAIFAEAGSAIWELASMIRSQAGAKWSVTAWGISAFTGTWGCFPR